ncbi:MAG: hypothetical protein ACP5T4_02675 [Candidatus Micrarchaeia archaeon]
MPKTEQVLVAVLAVFLLTFIARAILTSPSGGTSTQASNTVNAPAFIGISLLALTVSIDVVAIGYVIGKLVPSSGVLQWLNNEYWEIAKSAMLIAGIYAILTFMTSISLMLSGVATPTTSYVINANALEQACNTYFANTLTNISAGAKSLYGFAMGLGFLRGITISASIPIPIPIPIPLVKIYIASGFSSRIYANQLLEQGPTTGTYESMINDQFTLLIIPLMFITIALQYGLPYLMIAGLGILIPLGVVFRAFPIVRGIGGTLVGMGIAMAVILPSTVVLLNMPASNALAFLAQVPPIPQSSSSSPPSGILGAMFTIFTESITALFGFTTAISDALNVLSSVGEIYSFLNVFIADTIYLVFQLLLFIFDLIIVYELGNNIAKSLGGTFRLSLGGKLKLA